MSRSLAIIWFSRTGTAQALAEAAYKGAQSAQGVTVQLVTAAQASTRTMLEADGYIFACPENLAAIAGGMKEFFDQNYYPLLGKIEGRPYAAMIAAGSDGESALKQVERIATGWRLRCVADSMIVNTKAQSAEEILAPKSVPQQKLDIAYETGAALANGLEMGLF